MSTFNLTSWMQDLPDTKLITEISIPGTHDSCSLYSILASKLFGFAKNQHIDLPGQFNSGIRFIDIRARHFQNDLWIHHGRIYQQKKFSAVMSECVSFLQTHPSETILMLLKDEHDAAENTETYQQTFEKVVKNTTGKTPQELFYLELGTIPSLKNLRGKIWLLRRFKGNVGVDLTYWPDNQAFTARTGPLKYSIQDCYADPGGSQKFSLIINQLDTAVYDVIEEGKPQPDTLYINYASAVASQASGYSKFINPKLNVYLKNRSGRIGIIPMDYFEDPADLVSRIIKTNFSSDHWWATKEDLQPFLDRSIRIKPSPTTSPTTYWEVEDSSRNNGALIQLWQGRRDENTWKIRYVRSEKRHDWFSIYNPVLDKYVTLEYNNINGSKVFSNSLRTDYRGQKFLIRKDENLYSFHIPGNINQSFECENGNLGNSTKIQQWDLGGMKWDAEYRTQWRFEYV